MRPGNYIVHFTDGSVDGIPVLEEGGCDERLHP